MLLPRTPIVADFVPVAGAVVGRPAWACAVIEVELVIAAGSGRTGEDPTPARDL